MHELSVCRALLRQINQIAEEHLADDIKVIRLKIGPLAGIDSELLRRAFPLVSHGTAAQHATLEITSVPATIFCNDCEKKSDVVNINQLTCPHCNSTTTQLLSGDEMTLDSVILGQQSGTEERYVH